MALTPASSAGATSSGVTVLYDTTLSATAATIDTGAAGIAASCRHLLVIAALRSTKAATTDTAVFTFNADTSGVYYKELVRGFGASVGAVEAALAAANIPLEAVPGGTATAGLFTPLTLFIPNYASSTVKKAINGQEGYTFDLASTHVETSSFIGYYNATTAISRMTLTPGTGPWAAGSSLTVLGLGAA